MPGPRNRYAVRAARAWFGALLLGIFVVSVAAAEEIRAHKANEGGPDAFAAGGRLDDANLRAVRGFGTDPAAGAGMAGASELSVILFDELGRPKPSKPAPQNTGNSTLTRGINVQVGR
jgi:hypothetical protein